MAQQKLCLKWNNHTINLLAVLENFQSRDILVDVTLSCEGRNIKAHKMVLSACSPYFQNIFLENPCQHPIVIINGMKYEDITAILNFMYKGEVNVSHEGLSSFLQAAEALKVKGLAEVCGDRRGSNSNSQEAEPSEPARPQRTDTPTKKRPRNRKRSFSDSNRSDDEGAPRKHKEINSPEVHELSGDESYTGDMSSNGQPLNSRVPQNVYSRSHQSSSNITPDDMEDEYEVEPSKMLEQTLTENANNSTSSDNGLRIERIVGNAPEMESSSLQEPESPPDIKPIIEYGESSAGPSEGNMLVYNEQSQPGPSNIQDGSLLHDNSHTQAGGVFRLSNVRNFPGKSKQKHQCETVQMLKDLKDDPVCICQPNQVVFDKDPVVILDDFNANKNQKENLRCLNRSKQLVIVNEEGCLRGIEVNKGITPRESSQTFGSNVSVYEPSENDDSTEYGFHGGRTKSFSKNPSANKFPQRFGYMQRPGYSGNTIGSNVDSRKTLNMSLVPQSYPHYSMPRNVHQRPYTGKKRGRKPKCQGNRTMNEIYPGANSRSAGGTVLQNRSYTQVSFEEVHLAPESGVSRPRRSTKKKSASEILMLQRKIRKKIVQSTSYEYETGQFNKQHTSQMNTDYSMDSNHNAKYHKKSTKVNKEKHLVKKNYRNTSRELEKYGPELLPPGWNQQIVTRKTGKTAGKVDIYFVTPEGKRLRSKVEVASYIEQKDLPFSAEEFCFRTSAYGPFQNSITY